MNTLSYSRVNMPAQWSVQEDVNLCIAFMNVSEDSSLGTDQSSTTLWTRVFERFEQLRLEQKLPRHREKPGMLQNRWASKIKPDVALYVNLMQQVGFVYIASLCMTNYLQGEIGAPQWMERRYDFTRGSSSLFCQAREN